MAVRGSTNTGEWAFPTHEKGESDHLLQDAFNLRTLSSLQNRIVMTLKKQMLCPSTPPHPPSRVIGFIKTFQINCSKDWIAHSQLNSNPKSPVSSASLQNMFWVCVCGGVLYKFGQYVLTNFIIRKKRKLIFWKFLMPKGQKIKNPQLGCFLSWLPGSN